MSHQKEPFSIVMNRELEMLYRVAKRMTRSAEDAEDVVSQTLVAAYQNWDRFDGRYPRGWFLRILRNEWLQIVRKRNLRQEVALDSVAEPEDNLFWKHVDKKLESETILDALESLPEEYRLAVTLCDVEQLNYEEAANALEVPVGTIRSRLFRGRKLLRTRLVSLQPS